MTAATTASSEKDTEIEQLHARLKSVTDENKKAHVFKKTHLTKVLEATEKELSCQSNNFYFERER